MHKDWEDQALNVLPKAIESVLTSLRPLLLQKLQSLSARQDSLNAINSIVAANPYEEVNNAQAFNNDNDNAALAPDKSKVRTLGAQYQNPFTPASPSTPEPVQTPQAVYSGPSAFNDNPNGLYGFVERGGFSGTFILLAGVILMVLTFLVTFMVLTYFKI